MVRSGEQFGRQFGFMSATTAILRHSPLDADEPAAQLWLQASFPSVSPYNGVNNSTLRPHPVLPS